MANVLSGSMVFLVADTETGTNYRISPAMIAQYCNVAPSQQVDVPGGVAGINANGFISEAELPLPAVTLTTLLANKLA